MFLQCFRHEKLSMGEKSKSMIASEWSLLIDKTLSLDVAFDWPFNLSLGWNRCSLLIIRSKFPVLSLTSRGGNNFAAIRVWAGAEDCWGSSDPLPSLFGIWFSLLIVWSSSCFLTLSSAFRMVSSDDWLVLLSSSELFETRIFFSFSSISLPIGVGRLCTAEDGGSGDWLTSFWAIFLWQQVNFSSSLWRTISCFLSSSLYQSMLYVALAASPKARRRTAKSRLSESWFPSQSLKYVSQFLLHRLQTSAGLESLRPALVAA